MTVEDFISTSDVSGWDIGLAVLVLIATWVAFRLTRKAAEAAVDRIGGLTDNMRAVIVRIAKYLVLLLGVGVALTFLGAQLQPLLTVFLIVAAVLVLALRGVADNFGAGMVIQTRRPVSVGDEIVSQGYVGVVRELNGRSVVIGTLDGRTVHLPNADLIRQPLTNNSERGARRSEIEVRCTAPGVVAGAVKPLISVVRAVEGVLADPPPEALVITVDPERVTLRLRFWHQPLTYVLTTSAVVEAVGNDLRARQIIGTATSDRPDPPLTVPGPV